MNEKNPSQNSIQDIHDIKKIMERSSRFISLSGLSGIAAGIFAIVAAWFAYDWITEYYKQYDSIGYFEGKAFQELKWKLLGMAGIVIIAALLTAFYFTWRKTRQDGQTMWTLSSRRLLWNTLIPLMAGGLLIFAMLQYNEWRFVSPCCLIFYGLALVNGSKYTLSDIRYLGYLEIILGLINTQFVGYGLYFWALGFGILHIIYGIVMWWKYERKTN